MEQKTNLSLVVTTEEKTTSIPPVIIHRAVMPAPFDKVVLVGVFPINEPIQRFRIQIPTPFGLAESRISVVENDYVQPPVTHQETGAYEFITGYGFALWCEDGGVKIAAGFARTPRNILGIPGGRMYVPAFVAGSAFSYRNLAGPKAGKVEPVDETRLGSMTQNLSTNQMLEMYGQQHGLSQSDVEKLVSAATTVV